MKPATMVRKFKDISALVVGDICLDRWCHYDPSESDPSRETRIPRLGIVRTEVTPGAGGTVASNLAALGAARDIDYSLLVASSELQTFTYTKLINTKNGREDKPRVDFINNRRLPSDVEDQLIVNFHSVFKEFDVIAICDQSETEHGGVVSAPFRDVIAEVAERYPDKVVLADSRTRIERFRNAIGKANREEAIAVCKKLFGRIDYPRLRKTIGDAPLVITRGPKGVVLFDDEGRRTVPAIPPDKIVDECGAGDSFSAGLVLALKASGDLEQAAAFANLVSSVTIEKSGTVTATAREVVARAKWLQNGTGVVH